MNNRVGAIISEPYGDHSRHANHVDRNHRPKLHMQNNWSEHQLLFHPTKITIKVAQRFEWCRHFSPKMQKFAFQMENKLSIWTKRFSYTIKHCPVSWTISPRSGLHLPNERENKAQDMKLPIFTHCCKLHLFLIDKRVQYERAGYERDTWLKKQPRALLLHEEK